MRTVTNAEELGKAIQSHDYPISVKSEELVGCIESLRNLSRLMWIPVASSTGSVVAVMGTVGVIGILTVTGTPIAGAAAVIAATGGSVALAIVGLDVTISAVKISKGGGGVKVLGEIRSRQWIRKITRKVSFHRSRDEVPR